MPQGVQTVVPWIGNVEHLERALQRRLASFAPPCAEAKAPQPTMPITADQRIAPRELQQTTIDYERLYQSVTAELQRLAEANAQTVVLIVDAQNLPDIPRWRYVSTIWQSRLPLADGEQWAIAHLQPQHVGLGNVSYFWAGTFVLESFQLIAPQLNYVLIDSDAVPTALWEVSDLLEYAQLGSIGPLHAEPQLYLVGEPHSIANAGVVIAVGKPDGDTNPIGSSRAYFTALQRQRDSITPDHGDLHPWLQGTMFHYSAPVCVGELLSAWALTGLVMNALAFPDAATSREPSSQHRDLAPFGMEDTFWQWAGPVYEQGGLALLVLLDLYGLIFVLPGDLCFMHHKLADSALNAPHLDPPLQPSQMPPLLVHGYGKCCNRSKAFLPSLP